MRSLSKSLKEGMSPCRSRSLALAQTGDVSDMSNNTFDYLAEYAGSHCTVQLTVDDAMESGKGYFLLRSSRRGGDDVPRFLDWNNCYNNGRNHLGVRSPSLESVSCLLPETAMGDVNNSTSHSLEHSA